MRDIIWCQFQLTLNPSLEKLGKQRPEVWPNKYYWMLWNVELCIAIYLHLPSIFPIKCVEGPSAFMRAGLHRYVNQHCAIYIVLLSAYEVVGVNGKNAFPYVHFKKKNSNDL